MRFATKSTLTLLAVYCVLLGGLAVWLDYQLHAMADTLMERTARLVGGEIATAMSESAIEPLLHADPDAHARLEQIVATLTSRSDVIASIAVVDDTGKVVVSDDLPVGQQLPVPGAIFQGNMQVQFFSSRIPLAGGKYHLFVPLLRSGSPVGYLRLSLSNVRMSKLYQRSQRQLLIAASAGLGLVALLSVLFHAQMSRRSAALTRALESAMRGEVVPIQHERDEFAQALRVARQVGEELHAARERSADAQRRFATLMRVMDVGVVVLGTDLSLEYANEPARDLLGCRGGGTLEERWPEIRQRVASLLHPLTGQAARVELDIPRDDVVHHVRLELYPREDTDAAGYLVIVKSREMIDALEKELRLAVQMRGLARFYLAFAHDLKAPLNAMALNLELLKNSLSRGGENGHQQERQTRYVTVLGQELARLDRSLRTLLTQAALPNEAEQRFDLRELIDDLATLLAPQAKHQQVAFETEVPEGPIAFVGHRDRLKQAMLNIAINALESMPHGGRMRISLCSTEGRARIAVRDTGPGIPRELLGEIYGMHFTTKAGGSGIGLYVARSVVEAHAGEIRVDSEVGGGTCFEVDLPVSAATVARC